MPPRIVSLDQFRGYTVLGMFIVDFLGGFSITPALLKHKNTFCSYADTIMPHFFFAVGLAFRLTWLRRVASHDTAGMSRRFLRRNARLILFGIVLYLGPSVVRAMTRSEPPSVFDFLTNAFQGDLFQTLVHIGVTAIWILPVIGARPGVRLGWACGSAGVHLLLSHWFYYGWVNRVGGIDGGPLGFLTWTIPMIAGTLAYDLVARQPEPGKVVRPLLGYGVAVMALGYALSCLNLVTPPNSAQGGLASWLLEPPFVPPTRPVNLWTMNQRAGSVSYLMFGAGLSLALYALFVRGCDVRRLQLGILRTLGSNPLAGYVIHIVIGWAFSAAMSRRAPWEVVLPSLLLYLALCYACVRLMEKKGLFWRM